MRTARPPGRPPGLVRVRSALRRRPSGPPDEPRDRRLVRAWRLLAVALVALGAVSVVEVVLRRDPWIVLTAALVGVVAAATVYQVRVVRDIELERRREGESFARILRGLSRSVSPDAIVEAIVEDLGEMAGADHTVVVRLRPEGPALEATLVSSRAGVPSSTTLLPASDLEDPGPFGVRTQIERVPVPMGRGASEEGPARRAGDPSDGGRIGVLARSPRSTRSARPWAVPPEVDAPAAARIARRIAERVGDVYGLRHLIEAPLLADGAAVGAIVLSRRLPEPWSAASVRLLADASTEASAALARAYSHRAAEARASTDALTGLPNRRYFDEFCGLLARRRRAGDAVGVVMVDIDHFKQLNDTFGHPVGDQVLKAVAGAIGRAVRDEDVPARYGGEEFAVLLRNPSPSVAAEVGERIRTAVAALDLARLGPERVTVSVGVAIARSPDQPIGEIVDRADGALYEAKRLGRDRVVAA